VQPTAFRMFLLEELIWSGNSLPFMEAEVSLPCSQELAFVLVRISV